MKKKFYTRLIAITGLLILSTIYAIQLKAQAQWKELTVQGSSQTNKITSGPLAKDKSGNIYAALGSGVYKWNGSKWSELGSGASALNANSIYSIITDADGNVYASVFFPYPRKPAYEVVKWDGTQWSELGTGPTDLNANSSIQSLTIDSKGNIYAAGDFTNGSGTSYVAKWNGLFWAELGNDIGAGALEANNSISTITTDSAGNVYAAGYFTNDSGYYVAKWNGTEWSVLGSLGAEGPLDNLVTDSKKNVYVCGFDGVYKWNGNTWSELGTGVNTVESPNALLVDTKDSLYAAAEYYSTTFHYGILKWNGTTWIQKGSSDNGKINATTLTIDNAGNIYAAGANLTNNLGNAYVARFNGTVWAETGSSNAALNSKEEILSTANDKTGNVYAAGYFTDTLGKYYVAKWNGSNWSELGTGTNALNANGIVSTITTDVAGNVYAAGDFKNGSVRQYVAKWNGTSWTELGGGTIGALFANNTIESIITDAAGNIYAAGNFTNTAGKYYVAKWNGAAWAELGSGSGALNANGTIYAITDDSKGNIYAAGRFKNTNGYYYVAKWNGSAWTQLSGSTDVNFFNEYINTITSDSTGNIYTGQIYGVVAKWNGSKWTKLSTINGNNSFDNIASVKTDKSGNVYAAGSIQDDSERVTVQKWDGTNWIEIGNGFGNPNGSITSINIDLKGIIYAGGTFLNPKGFYYVAQYSTNSVLPLTLVSFTAQKQNNAAQLSWQTANEINTAYFNVQRSIDGRSFATVGKVNTKGSGKVNSDYAYADDISQLHSGKIYYRLQMTDKDGKFAYSSIRDINVSQQLNIAVTSNPVIGNNVNVNIYSASNAKLQLVIYNQLGQQIFSQQFTMQAGSMNKQINLSGFGSGNYLVSVTDGISIQTTKFIK